MKLKSEGGFDPPQPEGLVATVKALVSEEGRPAVSRELVLHLKRNALCLNSKTEGTCEAGGQERQTVTCGEMEKQKMIRGELER